MSPPSRFGSLRFLVVSNLVAAALFVGCGGEPDGNGPSDGGVNAQTDAGQTGNDGGQNGGTDAGGDPDGGNDSDGGSDPDGGMGQDAGVSFSAHVQPIFNARCTACHPGSGGFSLRAQDAWNNIVGVQMTTPQCQQLERVALTGAQNSGLYRKITGTTCGARMPTNGPLTAAQIDTIETWINEGAQNN